MNRTTTRAAFLSVLLHAGLLLLVFGMRSPVPPPAPPKLMQVRVVRLEDLPGAPPRTGDPAARGHRQPPAVESAPRTRRAETVPDPPAAPPPAENVAKAAASPGASRRPEAPPDVPPEPPALPELPATPPGSPATAAATALHLPATPRVQFAPPAEPDIAAAAEPAASRPATQPIAEPELEMLNHRFADWTGSFDAEEAEESMTWRHEGRTYTATLRHIPAEDDMAPGRVAVQVRTEQDGETLSMEMELRQIAFSNFAQFVDRWNPKVQIHDDAVDGRFHANSAIQLAYGDDTAPVFHGLVTLASRTIKDDSEDRLRRDELFPGGLKTGVQRIALPRHALPLSEDSPFPGSTHRLAQSARITFQEDGSYRWVYLDPDAPPEASRRIDANGHYIIGPEDGTLHVKGVVRGRVLVYAPETIIVEGNLVYATFPPGGPDGGDYLGLVADVSIEIAEPEITGPGDLVIHGSLYARRRFAVRDYRADTRATLLVYGSVAAGSISATEPRYATRILFDRRLNAMRPPGFPLTDRYELERQDREWTRETNATRSNPRQPSL
jgi:hypothetical protein